MSEYTQVGNCPKCGAPLYQPTKWWGGVPPPVNYTCNCNPPQVTITTTSTTLEKALQDKK